MLLRRPPRHVIELLSFGGTFGHPRYRPPFGQEIPGSQCPRNVSLVIEEILPARTAVANLILNLEEAVTKE